MLQLYVVRMYLMSLTIYMSVSVYDGMGARACAPLWLRFRCRLFILLRLFMCDHQLFESIKL